MPHYSAADKQEFFNVSPTLSNISNGDFTDMAYDARLNNAAVVAKLDPSARHAFMSKAAAKKFNFKSSPIVDVEIELGDNSSIQPTEMTKADLKIDGYSVQKEIFIIEMSSFCNELPFLIFGRQWLYKDNPIVDWHN